MTYMCFRKKGSDDMKEYQKPEIEFITLVAQERITTDGEGPVDGEIGLESSIF